MATKEARRWAAYRYRNKRLGRQKPFGWRPRRIRFVPPTISTNSSNLGNSNPQPVVPAVVEPAVVQPQIRTERVVSAIAVAHLKAELNLLKVPRTTWKDKPAGFNELICVTCKCVFGVSYSSTVSPVDQPMMHVCHNCCAYSTVCHVHFPRVIEYTIKLMNEPQQKYP
jgi:hypothetical protein